MFSSVAQLRVIVVGGGFAGSLAALILQRRGCSVALIERGQHPRFAIGESSTPTANFILRDLAQRHDLPSLLPLCKFGSWQRSYPHLGCGLKRGFSYFAHRPQKEFEVTAAHHNELLVAASSDNEVADTHWLRADVDEFFFEQARAAGVKAFERTQVVDVQRRDGEWHVTTNQGAMTADFLIDATGRADELRLSDRFAGRAMTVPELQTNSRAIFAHVRNLPRWEDVLHSSSPTGISDHPFRCDDAALHHVLKEGWMWWIRFSNNITSVGLVLHGDPPIETEFGDGTPGTKSSSAAAIWHSVVSKYPTLARAMEHAEIVAPTNDWVSTERLQRRVAACAGDGWAMLPHTVGFVDPLHSTGIAQSLAGVDRLTTALLQHGRDPKSLEAALGVYARQLQDELSLIDLFVSGAYTAIRQQDFSKFAAFSMAYFAAATTWERRRLEQLAASKLLTRSVSEPPTPPLFLADDHQFVAAVRKLHDELPAGPSTDFEQQCAELLAPWNQVGLFAAPTRNMYGKTAAE